MIKFDFSTEILESLGDSHLDCLLKTEAFPLSVVKEKYPISIEKSIDEGCVSFIWSDDKTNRRVKIKIGRMFKSFFKNLEEFKSIYGVTQSCIEKFSNYLTASLSSDKNLFVVGVDKIEEYYDGDNYYTETDSDGDYRDLGTLQSSCMRNYSESIIWFYKKLDIKMLVLTDSDGRVRGRALLWEAVSVIGLDDPIKLMDRIYYTKDSESDKFKKWAYNNGYWYKCEQNYSCQDIFNPLSGVKLKDTKMFTKTTLLNVGAENAYPYMDSLFYLKKDGVITNFEEEKSIITLRAPGADPSYYPLVEDSYTKEEYRGSSTTLLYNDLRCFSGDAVYLEYRQEYVHKTECSYLLSKPSLASDLVKSEIYNEYIIKGFGESILSLDDGYIKIEDAVYLDHEDGYALINKTVYVPSLNKRISKYDFKNSFTTHSKDPSYYIPAVSFFSDYSTRKNMTFLFSIKNIMDIDFGHNNNNLADFYEIINKSNVNPNIILDRIQSFSLINKFISVKDYISRNKDHSNPKWEIDFLEVTGANEFFMVAMCLRSANDQQRKIITDELLRQKQHSDVSHKDNLVFLGEYLDFCHTSLQLLEECYSRAKNDKSNTDYINQEDEFSLFLTC